MQVLMCVVGLTNKGKHGVQGALPKGMHMIVLFGRYAALFSVWLHIHHANPFTCTSERVMCQ